MALKVIGAGLGRTGTLSLKLALEKLGCGPCYHMTEILMAARERLPQWLEVVRGAPDWDTIFAGFSATVDYPTATYWRELAAYYPQAKVVLSDRDPDAWYDSVRATIFSDANLERFEREPMREFMHGAVVRGFADRLDDRAFMTAWFHRWREDVIASLPPERLLVHRSADGWEPLCALLGVPVPAEPYPRVNSRDDMAALHREPGGTASAEPPSPDQIEAQVRDYLDQMRTLAWG